MAPRWTYSEANASRWRHVFDDLIGGSTALEVPLEGNGKSLCSLRIRISDALKWLADQFRAGNPSMEPYARLKGRLRFTTHGAALRLHLKRPHAYRPVPHLDPALRARLQSALQRTDLKPTTRAKIEAALKQLETDAPGDFRQLLQRRPSPGLSHRGQAP